MKFLNKIKIYNSPNNIHIQYRKPTFNELYESIKNSLNNNVISESVFNVNELEQLFKYINTKEISYFSTEQLKEFFDKKSKIFKMLCKNRNQNDYKLYVIHMDFSSFENVKNILSKLTEVIDDYDKNELIGFYEELQGCDAIFSRDNDNKEFGIIWLNRSSSITDFQHEFIHYLEWITGIYLTKHHEELDTNYFSEQCMFTEIFRLTDEQCDYLFESNEYQTLVNDFLNTLSKIKQMYYTEISKYEFANDVIYSLFKNKNENVYDYLERVKQSEYFNKLYKLNKICFAMIVGYNCLNYKIQNLKNHIFGYFKK